MVKDEGDCGIINLGGIRRIGNKLRVTISPKRRYVAPFLGIKDGRYFIGDPALGLTQVMREHKFISDCEMLKPSGVEYFEDFCRVTYNIIDCEKGE